LRFGKEVLVARYSNNIIGKSNLGGKILQGHASSWWRDICSVDKYFEWGQI
jgi:hypothetical protein